MRNSHQHDSDEAGNCRVCGEAGRCPGLSGDNQRTATATRSFATLDVCKLIAAHLKTRSGKVWSVTHGRGTASGWITIIAPPKRCTRQYRLKAGVPSWRTSPEDYESYDSGEPGGTMTAADCRELADLLGMERPVHEQGEKIPAGHDYYEEYCQRAAGLVPSVRGEPYWD